MSRARTITIYHTILPHHTFMDVAETLSYLILQAQELCPGIAREVELTIEGHRTSAGAFTFDMQELQANFLPHLLPYVRRIVTPLGTIANAIQQNDVPILWRACAASA